jgi:hypothetical protein
VDSAFEQIRLYSRCDPAVGLRLLSALTDIAVTTPDPMFGRITAERGQRIVEGCKRAGFALQRFVTPTCHYSPTRGGSPFSRWSAESFTVFGGTPIIEATANGARIDVPLTANQKRRCLKLPHHAPTRLGVYRIDYQ